jgi:hypothetical protein
MFSFPRNLSLCDFLDFEFLSVLASFLFKCLFDSLLEDLCMREVAAGWFLGAVILIFWDLVRPRLSFFGLLVDKPVLKEGF